MKSLIFIRSAELRSAISATELRTTGRILFSFLCLIFCAFWGVKAQSNMHYVGTCGSNWAYLSAPLQGAGLTYSWNTGNLTSYLAVQNLGVYWVQTANATGIIFIDSFTVVNSSPCTVSYTLPACGNVGDTAYFMLTPTGGTAPFTAWLQSSGGGGTTAPCNPLIDSIAFPITSSFNPGFLRVKDSLGCYASYNDTVYIPICGIHADAGPDRTTCGSTYIGGQSLGQYFPFHYSWSPNIGMALGQDTIPYPYVTLPTNAPYMDYILTVTDSAGNVDKDTMRLTRLAVSTTPANDTVCYNSGLGTLYLNVAGASPYAINWGDGQSITTNTAILQHNYLVTGNYNVMVASGNCSISTPIVVQFCGVAAIVSGQVYTDVNGNNLYDTGDIPMPNHIVQVSPLGFAATNSIGIYTMGVDTLVNYSLTANNNGGQIATPASYTAYFPNSNMSSTGNDFAFTPSYDLSVAHYMGEFVPGVNGTGWIYYKNNGLVPVNATLRFIKDPNLVFVSSTVPYSSMSGDTITWNLPNLSYSLNGLWFYITLHTPSTLPLGTAIQNQSQIFPLTNDPNPANNVYISNSIVVASYDPNAKSVSQTEILQQNLATMQPLDYVVQFQNTGTAPAMNVIIKDTLSDFLDLTTFELRETSHTCQLKVIDNHILEWKFANIMLPDSNSNEPASHGFLHYTIKPFANLQINDEIFNSASIYFDFNAPIQTNTVSTKIVAPIAIEKADFATLSLAPNPVNKLLHLQISNTQAGLPLHLQILNLQGQMMEEKDLKMDKSYLDYEISTEKWAQGLYFVVLSSEEGYLKGTFLKE